MNIKSIVETEPPKCFHPMEPVTDHGCVDDPTDSVLVKERKRRRANTFGISNFVSKTSCDEISSGSSTSSEFEGEGPPKSRSKKSEGRKSSYQTVPAIQTRGRPSKKIPEACGLPLITADQYASRSAMLSSLLVAWSPLLKLSFEICGAPENNSSNCFSLLAVGSKSGKISLWRINAPQYYSIERSMAPTTVELIGILMAHNSWVTTISWALLASESSSPQVLLASGSSNGSVRIWVGHSEEFMMSTEVNNVPFYPLKESLHKMLLAVGRTSGAFEVWIGDTSVKKFNKAGQYDAHDQVVTGLAWAFDGCSLYSCSQDNFVRCWNLHGSSLSEVPIPSSSPGMKSFNDIPDVFIPALVWWCHQVILQLLLDWINFRYKQRILLMSFCENIWCNLFVRSFDVNQLDHMYEARLQKAAVEFFWIGGQQKDILPSTSLEFDIEAFPGFTEKELVYWESNILWSLKQYEHCDKPLVIWDIVAALLAFKLSAPSFVDHVLVKWLSILFADVHVKNSIGKILQHVCKSFCKAASRQLHLLNIICRRVILSELKADEINSDLLNLGVDDANFAQDKLLNLWMELLSSSERELRERLVGFSFSAYKSLASSSSTSEPGYWYPLGIAQMEQWVANNNRHVHKQQKAAATKIKTYKRSRHRKLEEEKEQCSCCSALVPFDSPEFAVCRGLESNDSNGQKHKLARCAVSMQVCPITTPLWQCKCCQRWISNLAPESLFTMPQLSSPPSSIKVASKPLCPLCGILLQRSQPEFLLSPLPV
ncbi:SER/ARG-rich protein 34A [Hibiscus syriacus]|uniref:SER/ARG-rich protein 34A n=1 Tax=Hibiscus syriacus TaxID=106335 RepID=A0A6A3B4Z2_HIBSY|nr:SER/ARG-rich protein 34A [Hibiscus syriacus]